MRAIVIFLLSLLGACAAVDVRKPVVEGFNELRKGTMLPINRTITDFTPTLRCMDKQLGDYGVKASLIVEDLNDKTQKVPAGTTDMFIAAMSQMTRRSRGIKTMAFSDDTKNLTNFALKAGSKEAFQPENIPTYAIRGSITQFDDNLTKKTIDAGLSLGFAKKASLGAGGSKSASVNLIAIDLAVVRARDYSVVPGANSSNTAAILQEGHGIDAEATYKKLGVNFMTSLSKSDGKSTAVRNLVELSAVELMGKLAKVPYWKCLDIPPDQADVTSEIEDWHHSMSSAEKLAFYLRHFKAIGLLPDDDTPVKGAIFKEAFRSYVKALGINYDGKFSLELMKKHYDADQNDVAPKALTFMEEEKRKRLDVQLSLLKALPGDDSNAVRFHVVPNIDSYTYCFLLDENQSVLRVFPNHWTPQAEVPGGKPFMLPQQGARFMLESHPNVPQSLTCFATRRDVSADLPALLGGDGLTPIKGASDMAAVQASFSSLGEEFSQANVDFQGRQAQVVTKPRDE
jgi:curli biogenesis system outer membrane secretion channel CsgG